MIRLVPCETVTCDLNMVRTYDRWVGACFLDGEDIGAMVNANGLARDCRRYSGGACQDLEAMEVWSRLDLASYCR